MFFSITLHAQDQPVNRQNNAGQDANTNGNNEEAGDTAADAPASGEETTTANIEENADAGDTTANTGAGANAVTDSDAPDEAASNVPPVPQTTTSQSGSPAVLSDDDGTGRDGTNNVQRASMNMAGAPASNLKLGDNSAVQENSEMNGRQALTRAKSKSSKDQDSNADPSGEASNETNANNRRGNNAQSDQNLSSKEKEADTNADQAKKKTSKRKRKGGK